VRSTLVPVVATAAIITVALSGCAGTKSNSSSSAASNGSSTLASAPGFDPSTNTITIGALLPLTGPQAGPAVLTGLDVFVKQLNAAGGINGKYKLKISSQDTQYTVPNTLQGYNGMKDNVSMFSMVLGTAPVAALLPQLKTDQTVAIPISNSSMFVHEPNLVPTQTTYSIGAISAADYLVNKQDAKTKTWCVAQQDDAFGKPLAGASSHAASTLGFTIKTTVKFAVTDTSLTAQIQQLKNAGCQIVFFNGVSGISITAMTAAQQANFTPQWIPTMVSYVPAYASGPLGDYLSKNWIMPFEGGVAWTDPAAGQQKLVKDVAQYAPGTAPSDLIQWGYTDGMATVQILEQAIKDGSLSHAAIVKAVAEIPKLTFNGIIPDYAYGTPATRVPPSTVSLLKVDPSQPAGLGTVESAYSSTAAKVFTG
jgi:ABC-type branched-subunit amino acid transport system substrate-binding protein